MGKGRQEHTKETERTRSSRRVMGRRCNIINGLGKKRTFLWDNRGYVTSQNNFKGKSKRNIKS